MAKQPTSTEADLRKQIADMQAALNTMAEKLTGSASAEGTRQHTHQIRAVSKAARTEISPALRRLINEAPEPKRQRKERHMPSRVSYRCRPATSAAMVRALQDLTPAAKTIFFYVAAHPALTVPEIAAGVDLKEKTVANLLSVMKGAQLVVSEKK
jgi:DNA-directed RNA polymerase specialized sigma24 family protein